MASVKPTSSWLICPKPNPLARLRLLCFPYAGGGSSIFYTWPKNMPSEDIEICLIQLPGRENRLMEPPFTHLLPLVQTLTQVLLPSLNMPFAFFGHSMGGLISFELARHLRKEHNLHPTRLFISGFRAPQMQNPHPLIHDLPEPLFIEKLRQLGGTPEVILQEADLMQLMLPTLRADFMMCETYIYVSEPPLSCPISAFGGLQDIMVSRGLLAKWSEQTESSFTLRMLSGGHFFLHSNREFLLEDIAVVLKPK